MIYHHVKKAMLSLSYDRDVTGSKIALLFRRVYNFTRFYETTLHWHDGNNSFHLVRKVVLSFSTSVKWNVIIIR